MKKFDDIKSEFLALGIKESNIDYAINAVKTGTKKELILKNLTSDVRKVEEKIASRLIKKLFENKGGEFKHENRNGYWYASFFLLVSIILFSLGYAYLLGDEKGLKFIIGGVLNLLLCLYNLILTLRGKYRE